MIILAIDTCFARCAACLFDSVAGRVLAEREAFMERGHAEALAPMVQGLLGKAGLAASAVDRLAVTTGPGTFTGLRIGLSFARAFGLANAVPVVGLDSLRATGLAARDSSTSWLVVHKAGQSGFHYVWRGQGDEPPLLQTPKEIVATLGTGPALVLGTGAEDVVALTKPGKLVLQKEMDLPVLRLLAIHAAHAPVPASMPEPVYIRGADAKLPVAAALALRAGTAADCAALSRLHQACFPHGWSSEDITAMLAVPGTQALVGESDGAITAMLIIRAVVDEAEILTLAVAPLRRRLGHGARLLAALDALAHERGIRSLFLEVAEDNAAAQALYASAGYSVSGRRKGYYARGGGLFADALMMKREVLA